jgi:hypothetical protein
MEGSCSTGQSPQWAVVPVEEEDCVCVCSLSYPSMQCECAMLSSVDCPVIRSTLSHKETYFGKKLPNTICVLIFSTTFV